MSKEIRFGTDGWRGIIAEDFTYGNVRIVAQAISDYIKYSNDCKKKIVAIGYDTRFMSQNYARSIAEVVSANGIKVLISDNFIPTPALSLAAKQKSTAGGIMVTASHNPANFNGIKYKTKLGTSADPKITKNIERFLGKNPVKRIDFNEALSQNQIKELDLCKDYIKYIKKFIDLSLINKSKFNVLVDAMHGTADSLLQELLKNSKIKITFINNHPRCDFNGIKPEPIENNLKELKRLIKKGRYSVGLATDGDSDRVGAMTERGRFINSSQIFTLLLLYFINTKKEKVSIGKTVSCSSLIDKASESYKIKIYETPIGFKYLADLIIDKKITFACEESGGIGLAKYLPERDGILAQLLILEMMSTYKKSLGELMLEAERKFGRFFYQRFDLTYPEQKTKEIIRNVSPARIKSILNKKVCKVNKKDGIKYYLEDGSWILFRFSGTEPILRIYAESNSAIKTAKIIKTAVRKVI
jgi:alpha-D-glucose phosphate-specific phosphoglucomutase